MNKVIKKILLVLLVTLVFITIGIWKYYSYKNEIWKLETVYSNKSYFQSKIDNFYYKNLRHPNTIEYKGFVDDYFSYYENTSAPRLFESIILNEKLTALNCSNRSSDTNYISFIDYLMGNYCIIFQYDKNLKGVYSEVSFYSKGQLVENKDLKQTSKNIFLKVKKLYAYNIVGCDTSENIHIKPGSDRYYSLIKGVKENGNFIFNFEYSEYNKMLDNKFYLKELNKMINRNSLINEKCDLIYIPFIFIESENFECSKIN